MRILDRSAVEQAAKQLTSGLIFPMSSCRKMCICFTQCGTLGPVACCASAFA